MNETLEKILFYSLMRKKPELSIFKNCISEMFKKQLYFLPVFYLIMFFMKAQKNLGKITILKIWELVSLGDVKTHFGKLAMKWSIFRHDKKMILTNI